MPDVRSAKHMNTLDVDAPTNASYDQALKINKRIPRLRAFEPTTLVAQLLRLESRWPPRSRSVVRLSLLGRHLFITTMQEFETTLKEVVLAKRLSQSKMATLTDLALKYMKVRPNPVPYAICSR